MGKYSNGNSIRKEMQEIETNKNRLNRAKLMRQCDCLHRFSGEGRVAITPVQGTEATFRCKICGKEFNISRVDPEALKSAFDRVDNEIDLIKMRTQNDKDSEVVQAFIQYQKDTVRARDRILRIVQESQNNQNRRDDRRDRDQGNVRVVWSDRT